MSENNPVAERAHHPFSPSQLQSLEACPCYISKSSEHIRTIIGTIAHKSTETRLDDNRLDDDDAAAVAECADFYERRKYLMEAERKDGLPVIEIVEAYLPIDDCKFDDGCESTTAGYVDRGIVSSDRKRAELIDFKFGFWPIEQAENNLQGIAYALGLFRQYPSVQTIKFFFKQPLLDSIQEATFTREQIPALYLRVQVVVAEAREARRLIALGDWSKARPMVPACNFCANLGLCPKVAEFACKVGSKFYPLEIPENITPSMIMSPQQTSLGLRLAQVLAIWAKSFKSVITDRVLQRRAEVPEGFGITSRAEREVKNPAKYREVALEYLTESEYTETLAVSLGAVEEKISEKAPRGNKASTVEAFKQRLLDTGAVELGLPYSFLKATSTKTKTDK